MPYGAVEPVISVSDRIRNLYYEGTLFVFAKELYRQTSAPDHHGTTDRLHKPATK